MANETKFLIVKGKSENVLCYKYGDELINVCNPSEWYDATTAEIIQPDPALLTKPYEYKGYTVNFKPKFYKNGIIALTLCLHETNEIYFVLSVNLEELPLPGIPPFTFIDSNNEPEAVDFLVRNGLAYTTPNKRRSAFCEYPMVRLNLPLIFQHDPSAFQQSNIALDMQVEEDEEEEKESQD